MLLQVWFLFNRAHRRKARAKVVRAVRRQPSGQQSETHLVLISQIWYRNGLLWDGNRTISGGELLAGAIASGSRFSQRALSGTLPQNSRCPSREIKDAVTHSYKGLIYMQTGEKENAIAELTEAIRLAPDDTFPLTLRGGSYLGEHEDEMAIADLTEAIRLDPKDALLFFNRGLAWDAIGKHEKAVGVTPIVCAHWLPPLPKPEILRRPLFHWSGALNCHPRLTRKNGAFCSTCSTRANPTEMRSMTFGRATSPIRRSHTLRSPLRPPDVIPGERK
jgi:hypothetical protein